MAQIASAADPYGSLRTFVLSGQYTDKQVRMYYYSGGWTFKDLPLYGSAVTAASNANGMYCVATRKSNGVLQAAVSWDGQNFNPQTVTLAYSTGSDPYTVVSDSGVAYVVLTDQNHYLNVYRSTPYGGFQLWKPNSSVKYKGAKLAIAPSGSVQLMGLTSDGSLDYYFAWPDAYWQGPQVIDSYGYYSDIAIAVDGYNHPRFLATSGDQLTYFLPQNNGGVSKKIINQPARAISMVVGPMNDSEILVTPPDNGMVVINISGSPLAMPQINQIGNSAGWVWQSLTRSKNSPILISRLVQQWGTVDCLYSYDTVNWYWGGIIGTI
jgi:hypothetical protein